MKGTAKSNLFVTLANIYNLKWKFAYSFGNYIVR